MAEITGWLLDVYASAEDVSVWVLGDDGQRHHLHHNLGMAFYAAGRNEELRSLWRWLAEQPEPIRLSRTEKRDLFAGRTTVLAVECKRAGDLPLLFQRMSGIFPSLTYYNADINVSVYYSAVFGVFPLGRVHVDEQAGQITNIAPLESPWEIEAPPLPLSALTLEPDCDPFHAEPQAVLISDGKHKWRLCFEPAWGLLINLRALLARLDPDLLLTAWGDTWLLPRLLELSRETGLPLPLNRDPDAPITHKKERSYFSYGRVVYRGQQVLLAGRLHVDANNAVLFNEHGLEGVFELARVTSLPVQTVARVSPGTGISSMQIVVALKQGILVPWHKQQTEHPRSALDLLQSDMGGLVYQPLVGLHRDVAELDFISMYPSIMAHFNISPETILPGHRNAATGLPVTSSVPGLVPQTLGPLLEKRITLKSKLMTMPAWHPRRNKFKAMAAAHKALMVTAFGYLGYKNARFGKIEAHEAVTAYGRECLLRAKEAAEDMGYTVLHVYVDAILIKKPGVKSVQDVQSLLDEILDRTGLAISLDGIFKWVAFLPSTQDNRISVANRYFGVFQSGEVKARGIELRRHDTAPFIKATQERMLEILAEASEMKDLPEKLESARR